MSTALATTQRSELHVSFANKYEADPEKVYALLAETVLKSKDAISRAETDAFMIVCNQYGLNPFTKEIFGFMSGGKMLYVVSVDGWSSLINRREELNGIEFEEHFKDDAVRSVTCKIHRKDRALPTVITEYFSECNKGTEPWKKWPIRMLRHKAFIQCARMAFGLGGIMDQDEAERMDGYPGETKYVGPTLVEMRQELAANAKPALEATVQHDDLKPWSRKDAADFFAAWKASGYTEDQVTKWMRDVCGMEEGQESSLKVPLLRKVKMMELASTKPEPVKAEPASTMGEDEAECRQAMGLLGLNLAEQAELIQQEGGDWKRIKDELAYIADQRNA
jgi:phage recombination protein Bet